MEEFAGEGAGGEVGHGGVGCEECEGVRFSRCASRDGSGCRGAMDSMEDKDDRVEPQSREEEMLESEEDDEEENDSSRIRGTAASG